MIDGIEPYPAYKESGVPWLGQVPKHWQVLPNRALFSEVKDDDHVDEQLLSVTITHGVIRQADLLADSFKKDSSNEDKTKYKLVCPGDIAYNKMRAWQGAIGVSDYRGIISPAYVVQRPRAGADSRYFHRLLRTPAFAKEAERWSYGITSDMWSLRPEHFKMIYVCLPPLPEQGAIVRFLDYVDRRVRRYVRAKQKLIGLLEEQKQAIIHRAVTHGLDPDVPLKPSGVEWLGEVPEHWAISRLGKLTTRVGDGLHGTPAYVDDSLYYFINGNNLSNGSVQISQSARCVSDDEYEKHRVPLNDSTILMSINGTIGSVAYYHGESIILGKSAAYMNCGDSLSRAYLFFLLQSPEVHEYFKLESTGTIILNLSLESIRHLPTLLPPLKEQADITTFLELRTSEFSELIYKVEHEIGLLHEYRSRLIADVVTGKLDVRDAAAALPDEPDVDESETVDIVDVLSEDEEDIDIDALAEEI